VKHGYAHGLIEEPVGHEGEKQMMTESVRRGI